MVVRRANKLSGMVLLRHGCGITEAAGEPLGVFPDSGLEQPWTVAGGQANVLITTTPRPSWSQGGKREVSPRVFCRSGKQPSRETREDPVPVRRRAEVKAEAITHVHGDVPARIGKVERGPSFVAGSGNFVAGSGTSVAGSGTRVPAGHDRNEDGGG